MRERWKMDRARDRLVVTAAMLERLQDRMHLGMLRPDQADEVCALIATQIDKALDLIEEASAGLRASPPVCPEPVPVRARRRA